MQAIKKTDRTRLWIAMGRLALMLVLLFSAHLILPLAQSEETDAPKVAAEGTATEGAAAEEAVAVDAEATPGDELAPTEEVVAVGPSDLEKSVRKATEDFLRVLAPMPKTVTREELGPVANVLAEPVVEDTETAIFDFRKMGFVPMKSVTWLNFKESEGEESGMLLGLIVLEDGRGKHIEVRFDGEGKVLDLKRPDYKTLELQSLVETFMTQVRDGKGDIAWKSGATDLRDNRDAASLVADLEAEGLTVFEKLDWTDGKGVQVEGGYRLDGKVILKDGSTLPFSTWVMEEATGGHVLDIQSTQSVVDRISRGDGDSLDHMVFVLLLGLILGLCYIMWSYARGLTGSPYELYLLFFTKVTEYSAYGAASLTFMFYLREDVGMNDIAAGSYFGIWSTGLTFLTMAVGAVCDAIGIKKTLLIGAVGLMFSRAAMPFVDGIVMATLVGFVPLALGIAITGPVLSVGIKRFTTLEGATLGFGLFYTLMNVGWAVGAWLFDYVRLQVGDTGSMMVLGSELSVWKIIIGIGFFINLPDLIAILCMRDGVEMTETGVRVKPPKKAEGDNLIARVINTTKDAVVETAKIFGDNFVQKAFWMFIGLIGITVFARLIFFHFHLTWPTYGIRYLGQGSLIGNLFGVLNPVMIVFLVPLFAAMTQKVRSYWMLLVGTVVSVASTVFVLIPPDVFMGLTDTWVGTVVFDRWLEVPIGRRDPFYLSMVFYIFFFTIGEAIWSPRLMQFTAEIAPPGREGSYVALAYLPYFGAKLMAGPMAGMLLSGYVPEFGIDGIYQNYPDHQMVWWWIGGTAALTPIGLMLFRALYKEAEDKAEEEAERVAAAERAEGAGEAVPA